MKLRMLPGAALMLVAAAALSACAGSAKEGASVAPKAAPRAEKPPMVTRAEWGSTPDPIPDERHQTPTILTIHHEGDKPWTEKSNPFTKLRNLQEWGKQEKSWPDVPYHYLIAPNGQIFEGRDITYQPETNTKYDLNGHVGIMLWGNFEEQRVSPQQLESVTALCAWLAQEYHIDPATIETHKDAAPGQTVCPGRDFYRYIHEGPFRQWVVEAMAGGHPQIVEFDALPEGPTEPIPMGINEKPVAQ